MHKSAGEVAEAYILGKVVWAECPHRKHQHAFNMGEDQWKLFEKLHMKALSNEEDLEPLE